MNILVTGGAGFIGSALIRFLIKNTNHNVLNIDKLTYAGNLESLVEVENSSNYTFRQTDICDAFAIAKIFNDFKPDIIMHLAAESHVDRSIAVPIEFINTNIVGTYVLLEAARNYWQKLDKNGRSLFRFHHVSTDEVFGDLGDTGELFLESSPYSPSSPYSASKASSDHLVRAWHRTYGLPVIITNCSNNYGPYQFPEKLIPLVILNALKGKKLPIYGQGNQIRDWLYVEDHARALYKVVTQGSVGETYNIGAHNEKKNIEVVKSICHTLDQLNPMSNGESYETLITFVEDRPGHDQRYAIDASKIMKELEWIPNESFESGIRKTVMWYLNNQAWCHRVQNNKNQHVSLGEISK